jgi:hypothetical protein
MVDSILQDEVHGGIDVFLRHIPKSRRAKNGAGTFVTGTTKRKGGYHRFLHFSADNSRAFYSSPVADCNSRSDASRTWTRIVIRHDALLFMPKFSISVSQIIDTFRAPPSFLPLMLLLFPKLSTTPSADSNSSFRATEPLEYAFYGNYIGCYY